jgi:serine/threonine-protein kinase
MEIGGLLDGKYLIERILGEGGMGAVYLAENTQIGRKVAIKVLHADFAGDDQVVARFRMEARAAAAIGHPGIVDVLDMGQTPDGAEFIVMERLDGETLAQRIRARGRLPSDEAVPIVIAVLDALGAAHDKGVIHRDLKPDNVFLVERPVRVTKILDFGISKFQNAENLLLTRTGSVMGTPLYMSPEQARGAKDVTHLADLYAVGAILYEALGGRPPFTGSTYNEVIANVLMEAHQPLGEVRPDLGADLCTIVDSLLSKNPGDRPQHARVAKFQLEQALGRLATEVDPHTLRDPPAPVVAASIAPHAATRPQPGGPPAATQQRRLRAGALAVAGVALVALVGGLVATRSSPSVTPAAPAPPPPAAIAVTPPVADLALPPVVPPAPVPEPPAPPKTEAKTATKTEAASHAKRVRTAPAAAPAQRRPSTGLEIDHAFPGQ